ncbi:hypothetical protein ABIE45_004694 [Methylobacterium sp. OAE515]|uniref:hypothetical protein n=1 Tax=Methylobacterium sp. OAE515 TaxID=2817895 RepID=UPI00178B3E9E
MAKSQRNPAFPVTLPGLVGTFCQESSVGKTMQATLLADTFVLADHPFVAFQTDDKPRLQRMLGAAVTSLRPDPERLLTEPALLRTALTPLHSACSRIKATGTSVEFDTGAKDVEMVCDFFRDVELDQDLRDWGVPMIGFVPFQADPEAIEGAAMTWRALRKAIPCARLVLVENRFERGALGALKPSSPARRLYEAELQPLVADAPHLVMPAMLSEFWQPFEEAGMRFIKVMAMDVAEGAKHFNMEPGDFKLARGHVTRFFQAMSAELDRVIALPKGGR